LLPLTSDHFLITGAPVLEFKSGSLDKRDDVASLPATGATVVSSDGVPIAVFAGPTLTRFRGTVFDTIGPGRSNGTAAALPSGRIVVIGGGDPPGSRDALLIDPVTPGVTTAVNVLETPRFHPLVAVTS